MKNIKKFFPIFKKNPLLIYLDNASTTQKPYILSESIKNYYENHNANIGRGLYNLAYLSETSLENSKKTIANFFQTKKDNLIFTSGATESLNLVQHIVSQIENKKKYIILPITEHHANIMTWQRLAETYNLCIYWISHEDELLNPQLISQDILDNTFLISMSHVSNVTGEVYPIELWSDFCNKNNIIFVVDGSQAVSSLRINLDSLNVDFYTFSAHKNYGPMGLGVLYIKNKFLKYEPKNLGGGIIDDVNTQSYTLLTGIEHFQSGTPNVANIVAYSAVLNFLNDNNFTDHLEEQKKLFKYLKEELVKIPEIELLEFGTTLPKTSIVSFHIKNIHSHDLGTYMANKNIAIRAGKHCTHPFHDLKNVNSTIRISIGLYNNKKDINNAIEVIKEAISFFNK